MMIGKRINGRYKIAEMIGGGGMANVYLAEDMILEREVAVKILRLDFANDEELIRRFNREAQAATSLDHPNIVNIYDVGEEKDIYYIVMEYVKGMTLKQYIQRYHHIPVEKTLHIMEQVTSAIEHAHQHGIIHRDIKPQNILIDDNDNVKITDFGIATALSATTITQTNSVLGSVHYLSPEQARGGMANKKSDVYSLGIVMFELLTGRLPFSGESAVSIALKHLQTTTPSVKRWNPSVPQSVENIVLKATAKDPFHRYDSVHEMKEDLSTALMPNRLDEPPFVIPEDMDATKAMPIITEHTVVPGYDDTIVAKDDTAIKSVPRQTADNDTAESGKEKAKKKKKNKKEKKPKKKLTKILLIILVTLSLLIVLALTVLPRLLTPSEVRVPDVSGETLEDAIEILLAEGLEAGDEIEVENDEVEANHIISTSPKAGRSVKKGTAVNLTVSMGPKEVELDNYVGKNIDVVTRLLGNLGFEEENIIVTEEYSDTVPSGDVIEQSPADNLTVVPSKTTVKLTVSKGSQKIELDDLSNYNEAALKGYASKTGFNITVSDRVYSDTVNEGLVIKQDPAAGAKLNKGSTVKVVISKGKEELPPKQQTIEITIPYAPEVEGEPQQVIIYIEDMTRDITVPADTFSITETTTKQYTVQIAPDSVARYKVTRDDSQISEQTIQYSTGN
ncbi:Stk1 family PASTA domain-containing Ser/Thr kinase [Bacillus sp. AGMB 02131]|uniref:Serine/threonine-protein kinase PrkC n=1 Tax=Peribacillus faecalis TaxID=2772559 RepID=A0A927H8R2_9BACI|nr:Stk1 family PASTA domain-containing Ser/Thr kinase [Peribacillus faecalis]MBD3106775.1 Stk1 family PASTA domain-containing Ser/Thr kinase [Peribacillus faecalis]